MAEAIKYITLENLQRYDTNIKTYVDSDKTKSIKAIAVKNNEINFFVDPEPTTETIPDFTVDFPVEYFLDQAKTVLVQEFIWMDILYPGSTDPSLEGKPVLVLAVKGDNDTVAYSFLNLEGLMKIYTGKEGVITISIDPSTNEISGELKISEEEGNILTIKEDGLYAEAVLDISRKADKLINPEDGEAIIKLGQILVDDGNGNLSSSEITIEELKTKVSDDVMGNFDTETDINSEIDNWF